MAIVALSILAKKRRSDQVRFSVPQLLPGSRERGNSGGVPRIAPGFRECGIHRTPETGDRGLERIRLGRMSEAQLCAPRRLCGTRPGRSEHFRGELYYNVHIRSRWDEVS